MDFTKDNENLTSGSHYSSKSTTDTLIIKSHHEELLQHLFMEIMLKASGVPFGAVSALPIAAKWLNFFFDDRCSQRVTRTLHSSKIKLPGGTKTSRYSRKSCSLEFRGT
jgi:hypothetical protein